MFVPPSSPIVPPARARVLSLARSATRSNDEVRGLLAELGQVPDPRARKGRRFALDSLLALAVCAMTPAGNDSLTAAAEWCQRATAQELAAFKLPYNVLTGRFRVPSEKTLRRVLGLLDPARVSAAGFASLRPVLRQAARPFPFGAHPRRADRTGTTACSPAGPAAGHTPAMAATGLRGRRQVPARGPPRGRQPRLRPVRRTARRRHHPGLPRDRREDQRNPRVRAPCWTRSTMLT